MVDLNSLSYAFQDLYWIGLTRARWYWFIGKFMTHLKLRNNTHVIF